MADIPFFSEPAQHVVAPAMIEFQPVIFDRACRACGDACLARAAVLAKLMIDLERHIGQNRVIPGTRAETRIDEQIVSPYPAEPCHDPYFFMVDVTSLALPVDDLGCGKRYRAEAYPLDRASEEISDHVKSVIQLTIMVQVQLGRAVLQCFKDTSR